MDGKSEVARDPEQRASDEQCRRRAEEGKRLGEEMTLAAVTDHHAGRHGERNERKAADEDHVQSGDALRRPQDWEQQPERQHAPPRDADSA